MIAKQLYELQAIEQDIAQSQQALACVETQLGQDEVLVQARARGEEAKNCLATLEREQMAAEWEVEDLVAKLTLLDKKLYGGSVKNPRELISLGEEVEQLKRQRNQKEEHLLDIMSRGEEAKSSLNEAVAALATIEKEWQEGQQRLSEEKAKLLEKLADEEHRHDLALGRIDETSLEFYQELSEVKQGTAVAKVEQGRCQGCRIGLPMSDLQRARGGQELVLCSNCGRILYLS